MPIFTEALSVVRAVEAHLIAEQECEIKFFSLLQRLIWFPLKFLKMGVSEKTKSASLWAFLAFGFLMAGTWFINKSGITRTEQANIVVLASILVPMLLIVFAVPSTYGDSGVAPSAVKFVADYLRSREFISISDIDLLKKSIKPIEDRARTRVTVLKWLVGLLWAGFVYMLTKGGGEFVGPNAQSWSYLMTSVWLLVCVVMAYLLVWGYEAALDKLFRAIEFGCNDCCHLMEHDRKRGASELDG